MLFRSTPAALAGKTVNCVINGGAAPFETSGSFALQLGTPSAGQYTIPVSNGNATARTGTYTTTSGPDFINIRLNGYVVSGATVEIELYPVGHPASVASVGQGRAFFEMFAGTSNKNGSFTIAGSGGGGGTVPVVTSATTLSTIVGVPFSYQITTNPAATSYIAGPASLVVVISPTGLTPARARASAPFLFRSNPLMPLAPAPSPPSSSAPTTPPWRR